MYCNTRKKVIIYKKGSDIMIIDITGTILIPGNLGKDCPGNGETKDKNGNLIECCCDECDYMLCCLETHDKKSCETCDDTECPHSPNVDGE